MQKVSKIKGNKKAKNDKKSGGGGAVSQKKEEVVAESADDKKARRKIDYYTITLYRTDGSSFETGSTRNASLHATLDKFNHPAWNSDSSRKTKTSELVRYQKRYGQQDNLDLGSLFGGKK